MKYILPFAFFIIISGFLWKSIDRNPQELPSVLIGKSVPHFNLATVEDPKRSVNQAIFKDRVTVLNVWASWCRSCKVEHETWLELTRQYKLFLVGLNYHDDLKEANLWLKTAGNPYQVTLLDEKGRLGMDLGVYGTPETFVLDKKGIIRYRHVGLVDFSVWNNTVWPLIQSLEAEGSSEK